MILIIVLYTMMIRTQLTVSFRPEILQCVPDEQIIVFDVTLLLSNVYMQRGKCHTGEKSVGIRRGE